jgi:hypothetical protein
MKFTKSKTFTEIWGQIVDCDDLVWHVCRAIWTCLVACLGKIRHPYSIMVRKSQGNRPLWDLSRNEMMIIQGIQWLMTECNGSERIPAIYTFFTIYIFCAFHQHFINSSKFCIWISITSHRRQNMCSNIIQNAINVSRWRTEIFMWYCKEWYLH